jgi:hypothetical protein
METTETNKLVPDRRDMQANVFTGVLSAVMALVTGCVSNATDQTKQVETRLTVESKAPYVARVEVENIGGQPVSLLKWYFRKDGLMPFELFVLERDGRRIRYVGSYAKLPGVPTQDDYFVIKPGEKASIEFSLEQFYKLTPGTYSAQYTVSHPQLLGGVIRTISNRTTFTVAAK